jgi:phage baseplate assembly protein W
MAINKPRHSDLNPDFGTPGAPAILYGENAVRKAIQIFLTSMVGSRSRTFNPLWGCDAPKLLQEPFGDITAQTLRATIIAALGRFEPRIEILAPLTKVSPRIDVAAYEVLLVYRMSGIDHVRSYAFLIQSQTQG